MFLFFHQAFLINTDEVKEEPSDSIKVVDDEDYELLRCISQSTYSFLY